METDFTNDLKHKLTRLRIALSELELNSDCEKKLGKAFDEYMVAAKSVAATVLSERIGNSFKTAIDQEGKPSENKTQKIEHARLIRNWLAPWNLAFMEESGRPMIIDAGANGPKGSGYSTYILRPFGGGNKVCGWLKIKQVLCSPKLVDATQFARLNEKSGGRH